MKKIAILGCMRANEVCTGAACLDAWDRKSRVFAVYDGQEVRLAAFLRCNGCTADPAQDAGMQEKLERLVRIGVSAVHLGVCTKSRDGRRCPVIQTIEQMLAENGIPCVDGTH